MSTRRPGNGLEELIRRFLDEDFRERLVPELGERDDAIKQQIAALEERLAAIEARLPNRKASGA